MGSSARILIRTTAAVVVGLVVAVVGVGWLFLWVTAASPEVTAASLTTDPRASIKPAKRSLVVQGAVRVADEEPPLLGPLVEAGALPALVERLPTEPLVLRGVDGIGRYGGTLLRAATTPGDVGVINWRLSYASPVRWTAMGDAIVPHVATSLASDDGGRTWTFTFRQGHRWSDGRPFTVDDVIYWWEFHILDETVGGGTPPFFMLNGGEVPTFEKVSDTVLRVRYETPYNVFPQMVASFGHRFFEGPKHFLSPYHPTLGDPEFLREQMRAYALPSPRAV